MPSRRWIQYVSKSERLSSGYRTGKSQFSSHFPRRVVTKECTDHWTVAVISQASKVMLKILHARLQHYENQELPDVQAGFSKGRGTRDQIANTCWIIEKAREFQKNISLFHRLRLCGSWQTGKLLERWEYQTISPGSWETCMRAKKQHLEPCMEQPVDSTIEKGVWQGYLLSPCLTNTLGTSWEMLG